MKNAKIIKSKHRVINLSQTAQLYTTQQSTTKDLFQRYRRTSLPNSIGHYSLNIRNSHEQPTTEIYFNPHKKSKFMKEIVDNYFEETLHKIYGNQRQSEGRQLQALTRNNRNIAKRGKPFLASISDSSQANTKKEVVKGKKQQEKHEQQSPQLYQSGNSSSNTYSFLPPIYESHEDFDDLGKIFPEMSQTSPEVSLKSDEVQRILTFENQAFRIYIVSEKSHPKYRVKQFKPAGLQILRRQQRALKFGIERVWKQSNINANSFVSELIHPLKNLICKLTPNNQGTIKFKIRSSSYRKYLLANNCLQLKLFIRQMCGILKKIEGRVLNNKINPSNIFILKGNRVCVGEWGYSSFRQQYQIQDNKFQSRVNPILKSNKEWLATPEYLSPELLQAVIAQSNEQEPDIWEQKSSSDIWSLGITLYQILTMIPIWINDVCAYKLKTKKPVVRSGLLGTEDRKLQKIAEKQKKMEKHISQCLQNELEQGTNGQILELVSRMLVYNPEQRISLDQIISIIK